jgi:hypothetical protein
MGTTCSGCGVALAPSDVLYSSDAKPVCLACNSKTDLVDTDKRAAANIVRAGWVAVGAGILSCFGQIALMGILAYFIVATSVISAGYALNSLSPSNERFSKYLTAGQKTVVQVTAVAGIVFSMLTVGGIPLRLFYGFRL